jgi:L-asparaginase/Glu-tRNA(Gln) amidotransferase subunit D
MQKILILATGGTIASDATENGLAPELTAADIVSDWRHTETT